MSAHAGRMIANTPIDRLTQMKKNLSKRAQGAAITLKCTRCRKRFLICIPCYRGQIYCSSNCAKESRRLSQAQANAKYQKTEKGRLSNRLRQQRYRARKKSVESKNVTDHSSKNHLLFEQVLKDNRSFRGFSHRTLGRKVIPNQSTSPHFQRNCRHCKNEPYYQISPDDYYRLKQRNTR
jgi:hypothetical protein